MPQESHRVLVPVVDLEQGRNALTKVVTRGVKQIQTATISADSHTQTQTTFNFQPPSQNSIIDRRFMLRCNVVVTNAGNWISNTSTAVVGTTGNYNQDRYSQHFNAAANSAPSTATLLNDGSIAILDNWFAPRQLPLMSCIDVIDLEINGTHMSVNPSDYIHALLRYTDVDYRNKYLSTTPHYPDNNTKYIRTYGEDIHPLGTYGRVGRNAEQPRGAFGSSASTTKLTFSFCVPLFISPLLVASGYEGMTNVNQLSVSVRWGSDLLRMFSCIETGDLLTKYLKTYATNHPSTSNLSVEINPDKNPELLVNYYTPQDDIEIPNQIVLPYNQPQLFQKTNTTSVGANSDTTTLQSDSIRINQVPQKVYIWAERVKGNKTMLTSDFQLEPNSVNITWNNQVGILSNAQSQVLYQMSKDNGLEGDYCDMGGNDGAGGSRQDIIGYAVCLEFGKDIPLADHESVGQLGNHNFQVEYVGHNPSPDALSGGVTLKVLMVFNGACVISPNNCVLALGNLDEADVMNARDGGLTYHDIQHNGAFLGGGLWGSLRHLVKRGVSAGKKAYSTYQKVAPVVQKGRQLLKQVRGGQQLGGSAVGGYRSRRR